MIISHSRRLIMISNPKTGSKSIEAALAPFHEEPAMDESSREGFYTKRHMPAVVMRDYLPASCWRSYFKVAFVRNPWDWFVSQHFYNLKERGLEGVDRRKKLSTEDIHGTYEFLKLRRGVEWSESGSQRSFVCDEYGSPLVDFLGRFENLRNDFEWIQTKIGIRVILPHINATEHRHYSTYYTDETREIVGQLYEGDVRIFGYSFE
jgi:hypothetical protein